MPHSPIVMSMMHVISDYLHQHGIIVVTDVILKLADGYCGVYAEAACLAKDSKIFFHITFLRYSHVRYSMPDGAEEQLLELLQDALFEITSVPSSSAQLLNDGYGKPHRWLLHLQPKSQLSLKLWQCQRLALSLIHI